MTFYEFLTILFVVAIIGPILLDRYCLWEEERHAFAKVTLDPEEIKKLLNSKNWYIRMGLVYNTKIPVEVLEYLRYDNNTFLSYYANESYDLRQRHKYVDGDKDYFDGVRESILN